MSGGGRGSRVQAPPRPAPPPTPPATAPSASIRLDHDEPPRSSPSRDPATPTPAASSNEMPPDMPSRFPHPEIDAAVLRLAFVGIIGGDRLGAAVADCGEPARGQPGFHQIIRNRLRALFGQCLVETILAIGVGVSPNLDIDGRTAQRRFDQAVEQPG